MSDHTVTPDVFTSSQEYARRFSGEVGEWFLQRQRQCVAKVLVPGVRGESSLLEVGGGHAQLTSLCLERGYRVVVQGSANSCIDFSKSVVRDPRLSYVVSDIGALPFQDREFDTLVTVRLLPHVSDWRSFLRELSRVTKRQLIFDYAELVSGNIFTPLLFQLKKRIEGNTREYFCHTRASIRAELTALGFQRIRFLPQFFFPMGVHRAMKNRHRSEVFERAAEAVGLTKLFGTPVIVSAER